MTEERELTEIIEKAMGGDEAAFEVLYKKYISTILYSCKNLLYNESDVYDVAQDVVIKLYSNLHKLKSPYSFYKFMQVITKNTCISHNRKMGLRRTENIDDVEHIISDLDSTPEAAYEKTELSERVQKSINKLPEKQRMALFMYYYRGLTYKEISCEMGITTQAVGTTITRAKRALSKILDKSDLAFSSAAATSFVFDMDISFPAFHIEHLLGSISKELAVGAKAASTIGASATGASTAGVGAGTAGGFFGSVSNIVIASVATVTLAAGGTAYGVQTWKDTHQEKPVINDWHPTAQIVFDSADENAGQEDPYHANLVIDGAKSMSWEITDASGNVKRSGKGREVGSIMTELVPGDYTLKWTVKNAEGKTVIVKREFIVSSPEPIIADPVI